MSEKLIKRELVEKLQDLPQVCYARLLSDGHPILLKRGVVGYWLTNPGVSPEDANERMGVNVAQEEAMIVGSLCGFDVPGADPLNYTDPTMYSKLEAKRAESKRQYAGKVFNRPAEVA